MDNNEEGTSAPPQPKQKPRPKLKPKVKGTEKGKSNTSMSATEWIIQDEQNTTSRGAKPGLVNRAAVAVPSGDKSKMLVARTIPDNHAEGRNNSTADELPRYLSIGHLPSSLSAIKQALKKDTKRRWERA